MVAYAAAMSSEAARMAIRDPEWDGRKEGEPLSSGEDIISKAIVWKSIKKEWNDDFIFPIPEGFTSALLSTRFIQNQETGQKTMHTNTHLEP